MKNEKDCRAAVRDFCLQNRLLCPGQPLRLAAAVSGGADSMALLLLLRALQPEFGYTLSACHVNHGLRGAAADRDAADHLTVMARALAASGGPWGVVSRQHEAFVHKCGLLQPTQGSLFSYFAWENARPQQLLTALTAEHKALLWESFLADGQQPLEFAWLWEIYYTDQTRWLLEWELALDMVLDQLSFQVNRDTNSFCLLDGTGRERRFDFTRGGPAEKLFLKLLFPLDTR